MVFPIFFMIALAIILLIVIAIAFIPVIAFVFEFMGFLTNPFVLAIISFIVITLIVIWFDFKFLKGALLRRIFK